MRINVPVPAPKTHEGAPAKRINAEQQLRRSVMACMLWEKTFYEDGVDIAQRIAQLVPRVGPNMTTVIAIKARNEMYLRHVPLLIAREMARASLDHRRYVAYTLFEVIQRADELTEFLAIYWKDGRQSLSAQVKKGLARAFQKFDAYQLAKYDRPGKVTLRDALFLCHAKPKDAEQETTWKQLIDGTLPAPDTWEVALSTGKDKKETWERLIGENKLGGLALLRNLRNMEQAGVSEDLVLEALATNRFHRVLPFRFIAAARFAPQWESHLEQAMFRAIEGQPRLPGKTVLVIDVSGSMAISISDKSDLMRYDAASGLAILARELCEDVSIYTFSDNVVRIPGRRGFALRDAIAHSQQHWGTEMGKAIKLVQDEQPAYDRLIVITDEQSHDDVPNPTGRGYVINVAAYKNGVGYGAWMHIDGFSEAVFNYIARAEDNNLHD
jgi:60 kDa SS-A/Ro ribonucleoprotein